MDDLFEGLKSKAYEAVTVIKPQPSIPTPIPTPVVTPTPTPVKSEIKPEPASPPRSASQSASASSTQSRISSGEPNNKRSKKSEENPPTWVSVSLSYQSDNLLSKYGLESVEGEGRGRLLAGRNSLV